MRCATPLSNSVSTRNCLWQLLVRPRGVEINPLSMGELILELLLSCKPHRNLRATKMLFSC